MILIRSIGTSLLIFNASMLSVRERDARSYPLAPLASIPSPCATLYPLCTRTAYWQPRMVPGDPWPAWTPPVDSGVFVYEVWCKPDEVVWVSAPPGTRLIVSAWAEGEGVVRGCWTVGMVGEEGCQ